MKRREKVAAGVFLAAAALLLCWAVAARGTGEEVGTIPSEQQSLWRMVAGYPNSLVYEWRTTAGAWDTTIVFPKRTSAIAFTPGAYCSLQVFGPDFAPSLFVGTDTTWQRVRGDETKELPIRADSVRVRGGLKGLYRLLAVRG